MYNILVDFYKLLPLKTNSNIEVALLINVFEIFNLVQKVIKYAIFNTFRFNFLKNVIWLNNFIYGFIFRDKKSIRIILSNFFFRGLKSVSKSVIISVSNRTVYLRWLFLEHVIRPERCVVFLREERDDGSLLHVRILQRRRDN